MKKYLFLPLIIAFCLSCVPQDVTKDLEKPLIDISQSPFHNCSVVEKGEAFTFTAELSDNVALASYSFDIHHNFDHHTHTTETNLVDCELNEKKEPIKPYKLITEARQIPAVKTYKLSETFVIPEDFDAGDYHFVVKVIDKSGWTSIKGLSFKVIEKTISKELIKNSLLNKIARIELNTHDGHLHAANFHANPQIIDSPVKKNQTMSLEKSVEGTWLQSSSDDPNDIGLKNVFIIPEGINLEHEMTEKNPGGRMALELFLKDKNGNLLNQEFSEQHRRYQIFFTVDSYVENASSKENKVSDVTQIFEYTYRDTNPSDRMYRNGADNSVTLLKEDDKEYGHLGLKGYFAFKKCFVSYKIKISIVDYLKENKASSRDFYQKPLESSCYSMSIDMPVIIIAQRAYGEEEEENIHKIIGAYFNMSGEEYEEKEKFGDSEGGAEGSQYWL